MSGFLRCGAPDILPRMRLFRQVERALQGGDLIVAAGAGFGKRALIGTWLARDDAPPFIYLDPGVPLPADN